MEKQIKILVTGSDGFIGKNLIAELENQGFENIYKYDKDTDSKLLDVYCEKAEFVFHLAGVNRPQETDEFMKGNFGFTSQLLDALQKYGNKAPIMLSSSIQAELDNPYGESKKAGENLLFSYAKENSANVYVYRFPNVFGKWSKPNYNSVIATFCHNIASDFSIQVNDPSTILTLVYIDDVVKELIRALNGKGNKVKEFYKVPIEHDVALGTVADLLKSFKDTRKNNYVPDMGDAFTKKLYSTYLSYLPENSFSYDLTMNKDERGSFTEFIKTKDRGQVSVNISKPGITKGNHWHHTKNEKFLVVSGNGVIRFRKIDSSDVIEYFVDDKKLEVVDIPTGYTHNIENLGQTDMITIMWANETYDPENPDTYFMEV